MNNLKFVFLSSIFYLSAVGWSSNNWMVLWFIMEVVFLAFVGLASAEVSYSGVEFVMKYFIIQVFISLIFLSFMVIYLFNLGLLTSFFLVGVLMMKLGMFPFHFWVIMVLGKLNWFSFFVLTTIVKLLPIVMVYYLNETISFNVILIFSAFVGSVFGLGNEVVQKILGYSSLTNLCWLILSLSFSIKIFIFYFLSYVIMMFVLILIFYVMNVFYINQLKTFSGSVYSKFLVFFLVLSLAGFPPFLGFLMKWIVVSMMLFFDMKILVFFMVFFSLFSVIFYLELFYYIMLLGGVGTGWYYSSTNFSSVLTFTGLFFLLGVYFCL